MYRRALRTRAVALATCLLAAVAVPAARAGTIWVTDGDMNAGQTGSCDAFAAYGDFSAFAVLENCPMSLEAAPVPYGHNAFWMTTAPPGIVINSAWTANGDVTSINFPGTGLVVGDFWRDINSGTYGGSTLAPGQQWFNSALEGSSNINSQIYGVQMTCVASNGCPGGAVFWISGIELAGTENAPPSVTGQGALWGSSSYVWNPPGDPWPVTLYASDVSGICSSGGTLTTGEINGPAEPRDNTVWQQCPSPVSWSFNVDTRSQVPNGRLLPNQSERDQRRGGRRFCPDKDRVCGQ